MHRIKKIDAKIKEDFAREYESFPVHYDFMTVLFERSNLVSTFIQYTFVIK